MNIIYQGSFRKAFRRQISKHFLSYKGKGIKRFCSSQGSQKLTYKGPSVALAKT